MTRKLTSLSLAANPSGTDRLELDREARAIRTELERSGYRDGFYGGLGERESVAAAYAQGRAAISLEGLPDHDRPRLEVRAGVGPGHLVLAADPG